jgi:anthranilate synthase component 1/para-aminobenzoate synthetase component 1
MEILPDQKTFEYISKRSKRVPVCGQIDFPKLEISALFRKFFSESESAFLFESGKGPDSTARYTMMGEADSCLIEIRGSSAYIHENGETITEGIYDGFDRLNFSEDVMPVDYLPHFCGGWVGYIGYEAGMFFESLSSLKPDDLDLPDCYFMRVTRLFVYDHKTQVLKYIISENNCDNSISYSQLVNEIGKVLEKCQTSIPEENGATKSPSSTHRLRPNMTASAYKERVTKAKIYIREGDIYQANLSQRFDTDFEGDPFTLYQNLQEVNPSPFSGYMRFGDLVLVSSSPERLVKVEGDHIETRPIAGTRPRGFTSEKDQSLAQELLLNEKERAEHLMLVDLERNDLGRICEVGSVEVTDLMFLEQYSHVSHIVSNIVGILKPGVTVKEILKAVFPGGTITGCPKIRCMEIINELEPVKRGPYSGSFGYIGFTRQMDLNIIIRTIVLKSGKAYFHVGAGIVADSDPQSEYQETLHKAAAMIEVLGGQLSPDE